MELKLFNNYPLKKTKSTFDSIYLPRKSQKKIIKIKIAKIKTHIKKDECKNVKDKE